MLIHTDAYPVEIFIVSLGMFHVEIRRLLEINRGDTDSILTALRLQLM